jgi:hypothetical protein
MRGLQHRHLVRNFEKQLGGKGFAINALRVHQCRHSSAFFSVKEDN